MKSVIIRSVMLYGPPSTIFSYLLIISVNCIRVRDKVKLCHLLLQFNQLQKCYTVLFQYSLRRTDCEITSLIHRLYCIWFYYNYEVLCIGCHFESHYNNDSPGR